MLRRIADGVGRDEQAEASHTNDDRGTDPFLYRERLGVENGTTIVQCDAKSSSTGSRQSGGNSDDSPVKHGVDDNLASLNLTLGEHARAIAANEERSAR